LELTYGTAVRVAGIDVHESGIESGFIDRVELRDVDGMLHTVWNLEDAAVCGGVLSPRWMATPYLADTAIIHTAADGWEEVDGVRLYGSGAADSDVWGNACDLCPFVWSGDALDSDADGAEDACDCAPNDTAVRPPAEVHVDSADRPSFGVVRLGWAPAIAADAFAITKTLISGLDTHSYGSCSVPTQTETWYEDDELPPPGDGFAYLIQGVSTDCGMGTPGAGPGGLERYNLDPDACR
jgi:hypothetical protein